MKSIKNFTNVVEAVCRIKELFGVNPFTSKEYNEGRLPRSAVIDTLVINHVVKVVRTEYFTKEVRSCLGKDYVVDQNGEIVADADQYKSFSDYIKNVLIKVNGGKPLAIVHKDNELVKCKRYYYAFDMIGYERYLSSIRMEYSEAIMKKRAEIEKLSKEISELQAILG